MNSLEASRVLAVLDDALEEVSLLSFVTSEVLETAEQLRDVLGARSPATAKLRKLHIERSPSMLQVIAYVTKLRHYAQKRLTTTVEEDSSNREYYEEVKEREERAVSEKIQLEQKLKLQRVELHKQTNQMQSAEDRTRAELHDLESKTGQHKRAIETGAKAVRAEDFKTYDAELQETQKELDEAKAELAALRADSKAAESALHKTKKRAQQDVESVIGEFDTDLGAKEDEYQAAYKEYQEVLHKLEIFHLGYQEMYQERMEYEEKLRQQAAKTLAEGLVRVRQNRAARVIQGSWKAYKARKVAEAKKRKKLEAAKAKKK